MIKPELYHKTVGILFDAYFNDTLEHGNCFACAAGNLVAANMGKTFCIDQSAKDQKYFWLGYCPYSSNNGKQPGWFPLERADINDKHGEVESTGYLLIELDKIERAFEGAWEFNRNKDEVMFNGLCAVLDVLAEIHQVTDQDLLTSNTNRFKEQYERRAVKIVL